MHLAPAEYVIFTFKGVGATARALGLHATTVSKWRRSGLVPGLLQRRVLDAASAMNLDINCDDLVLGREIPDSEYAHRTHIQGHPR